MGRATTLLRLVARTVPFLLFSPVVDSSRQDDSSVRVKSLIQKLSSEAIEDRDKATTELKLLGKAALPELEKAAESSDAEVARRASYLIKVIRVQIGLPANLIKTIPGIVERLALAENEEWTSAFLELSAIIDGKPRFPQLVRKDLEALVPRAIAGAKDDDAKNVVFMAVARRRLEGASHDLVGFLGDDSEDVRASAAQALGKLRSQESVKPLLKLLKDVKNRPFGLPNNLVRGRVIVALGNLQAGEAIPQIAEFLQDSDGFNRAMALRSLVNLHATQVIPKATALLKSTWWEDKESAIILLGSLNATAAIAEIRRLLRDTNPKVQAKSAEALGLMKDRESIKDIAALLGDANSETRMYSVEALGRLEAQGETESIRKLLKDPDEYVRGYALEALQACEGVKAIAAIQDSLKDQSDYVRAVAIEALATTLAGDAIPQAASFLNDESLIVRHQAILTLQELGAKDLATAVAKNLEDPDAKVREAAAICLCHLGSRDGAAWILKHSSDLTPLNALAQPDGWKALQKEVRRLPHTDTLQELLGTWVARAGITLVWADETNDCRYLLERWRGPINHRTRASALYMLDLILDELGDCSQVVLERGELRFMRYADTVQYWNTWMAATAGRK